MQTASFTHICIESVGLQGLEDQLRVLRRQALLRDPAARSRSGVTESEEASALEHAGSPGDDAALRQGSRGLSSEGSTGTTPPQPGPVANRLLVLTKRLEVRPNPSHLCCITLNSLTHSDFYQPLMPQLQTLFDV